MFHNWNSNNFWINNLVILIQVVFEKNELKNLKFKKYWNTSLKKNQNNFLEL